MEIYTKPPTTTIYTQYTLTSHGEALKSKGESLLRSHKLCVVILAGGQGTRLGSDDPKGMYELTEVRLTLFDLHMSNIKQINTLYKTKVKVVVMTSAFTHVNTVRYFERQGYFGVDEGAVFFVHQGSSVCFDLRDEPLPFDLAKGNTKCVDGKKESSSDGSRNCKQNNNFFCNHDVKPDGYPDLTPKFAVSPSGNGEIFKLLHEKDVYRFLDGIEYCNVISVDNVLARVCDPVFLGFVSTNNYDVGCKSVVRKEGENVGVFIQRGENVIVREYSELEKNHMKKEKHESDTKINNNLGSDFDQGNICNHMFTIEFMKRMGTINLPAHKAYKKIPYTDKEGKLVKPKENNGYKNELFIFDCLEYTKKAGIMTVVRELEFSPVKNGLSCSTDTPLTALFDLYERSKIMLEMVGAKVGHWKVLVMPGVSVFGENLERFKGRVFEKDEIINE